MLTACSQIKFRLFTNLKKKSELGANVTGP